MSADFGGAVYRSGSANTNVMLLRVRGVPGVVLGELVAAGAPDPLEARQLVAAPTLRARQRLGLPHTGQGTTRVL